MKRYTQTHLDQLVALAGVKYIECGDEHTANYRISFNSGKAISSATIEAPGAKSLAGYWATLHELGHIATVKDNPDWPFQVWGINNDAAFRHEAAAWRWAITHSEIPLCDEARNLIVYCMTTYRDAAQPGALDSPWAQDFKDLLKELDAGGTP